MKYKRKQISATVTAVAFVVGLCCAGAIEHGAAMHWNLIGCVCCLGVAVLAGYKGGWIR